MYQSLGTFAQVQRQASMAVPRSLSCCTDLVEKTSAVAAVCTSTLNGARIFLPDAVGDLDANTKRVRPGWPRDHSRAWRPTAHAFV